MGTTMPQPGDLTVMNLTARRIAIANRTTPEAALILPPFGERVVSADQAAAYDYRSWEAQQLVAVDRGEAELETPGRARAALLSYISGYTFLATLAVVVVAFLTWDRLWTFTAIVGLVATLACAVGAGRHAQAWANMARSLNVFFGLLLAFGCPALAIIYMSTETELALGTAPELPLALVLLWLFVGMASVLPAALFLFFHRQKVPTLRTNFLRDVVRLDPNVQTIADAETSYDDLIKDVYGTGAGGTPARGRLPILAATGLIAGLWIWTLIPGLTAAAGMRSVLIPEPDVVTFAFLGSYVFAINMLFRRYTRADLGPKAYTHIMVRIFAAVVTVWVLSYAPFARSDGQAVPLMLLLAFFIGIVPETGTAIIQDLLQGWKPIGKAIPSLGEDHPLSRLDGMSLYDRSHLLEAGIENVESLAHHSIIDLMLWTRIPTARLVDFVDQSILYLHLRGPADAASDGDPEESRRLLGRHGIRTATDLERAYALAAGRSEEEGEKLLSLLDTPRFEVHRLRVVMDAMQDDEWMVYVRNWRDQSTLGAPIESVEEFVRVSAVGAALAGRTPAPLDVDVDVDVDADGCGEGEAAVEAPVAAAPHPPVTLAG